MRRALLAALSLGLATSGCIGWRQVDPANMPQHLVFVEQPIILMRIVAGVNDYAITLQRSRGIPSRLHSDGDVVILAGDLQGRFTTLTALPNPRVIRSAGEDPERLRTVDQATVTVALPAVRDLALVRVEVRRGPNQKQVFRQRLPP